MTKILVIHGPNLARLGTREPRLYGTETVADLTEKLMHVAADHAAEVEVFQSNHEGALVDKLEATAGSVDGLIINPGGLTHTSVVLRDAVAGLGVPAVEVHVTNIYAREAFRRQSLVAPVAAAHVVGFGVHGYVLALLGLLEMLRADHPDSTREGGSQ